MPAQTIHLLSGPPGISVRWDLNKQEVQQLYSCLSFSLTVFSRTMATVPIDEVTIPA